MKTQTQGTLATVWTGTCPHASPVNRAMPDSGAPEWVQRLVRPEVANHDNGIGAGISAGEYWTVNGRPSDPAWTPTDGAGAGVCPQVTFGYGCRTCIPGDVVRRVRVKITPEREPAFPLPKVGHIPGWGLGVIGAEVTSSERGVACLIEVEMDEN